MLASFQEFTNRFECGEFVTQTVDETPVCIFFSRWLLAFTKRKADSSVCCNTFLSYMLDQPILLQCKVLDFSENLACF